MKSAVAIPHSEALPIGVVVSYLFVPPTNGGHRVCYDLCEHLHKKQSVLAISSHNNASDGFSFKLKTLFADHKLKYINPLLSWRFYQLLKKNPVQAVILNQPFHAPLFLPVCKWLNIPCIIYAHNLEYSRFKTLGKWWWKAMYWFEKFSLRAADRTFYISDEERKRAIQNFDLKPATTTFIPHLIPNRQATTLSPNVQQHWRQQYNIPTEAFILLFYGAYSYAPNVEALRYILEEIIPRLEASADFDFFFLICGGGLSSSFKEQYFSNSSNIHYAGFVKDLAPIIQTADIVLNPVQAGGGVKTKAIEALALNTTVVSSQSGAEGIVQDACGEQLIVVNNKDWDQYVQQIIQLQQYPSINTPDSFFEVYYWEEVVERLLMSINLTNSN